MNIDNQALPIRDTSNALQSETMTCEHCNEVLLFAMRDNYHEFSVGLLTVLQCLKLAEEEGHVPKLPDGWWIQLVNRYHLRC